MAGGYRISSRVKIILIDIHRQAVLGLDTIGTATSIESEERRRVEASYKRIIDLVSDTGVFE